MESPPQQDDRSSPPAPVEDIDILLGDRVRRLRAARRMSQADLGAKLGVSAQQVQKYERGANRVATATLIAMCNALEVSPSEMLSGFDDGEVSKAESLMAVTPQAENLLRAFSEIDSPAVRAAVLHLALTLASEFSRS